VQKKAEDVNEEEIGIATRIPDNRIERFAIRKELLVPWRSLIAHIADANRAVHLGAHHIRIPVTVETAIG
jgi:hypothetical protein